MSALVHPDRLFPAEEPVRSLARTRLRGRLPDLPIVSPHGHTDPRWYALNEPFPDPARLLIVPDHYIFRMLFSQGVPLEDLGVAPLDGARRRDLRPQDSAPASPSATTSVSRHPDPALVRPRAVGTCSVSASRCRPRVPTAHYDAIAERLADDAIVRGRCSSASASR